MIKKVFEDLMRRVNILPILLMAVMSVGFASCGPDDEIVEIIKPDPAPTNVVTITNNMSTTLNRFRVVFSNSKNEKVFDQEYGDFLPGKSISVTIPAGAVQYYVATYSGQWYFSADYQISVTSLPITDSSIWYVNS